MNLKDSLIHSFTSLFLSCLVNLIKTGHGDISLLLPPHSEHIRRPPAVPRGPSRPGRVDGRRSGAPEALLFVGGAPAQQSREVQVLRAAAVGAPGEVGALRGAGGTGLVRTIGVQRSRFLIRVHPLLRGVNVEDAEDVRFDV